MNNVSTQPVMAPTHHKYDKKFGYIAYGILLLIIILSTYIHHFQPQIMHVPSNTDILSWQTPSFEQTTIYDRMTEGEKERLVSDGVVDGGTLLQQMPNDIFMILVGWLCFVHARKYYGFWMASCFLIGSFIFTGLEESLWILTGRFLGGAITFGASMTNPAGEYAAYGSYWFTKGGFWFIETPIVACIGWFAIAYSCVWVAGRVFPKMGLWPRAAIGGLIAMGIDLWQDPVATSPELMNWVWAKGDYLLLFGIPFYNFIGWFLLIFLFAIFWELLPAMEEKWGRAVATNRFITICIAGTFGVYLFIFVLWFGVLGNIFSLLGLEHVIQIPMGW